MSNAIFNVMRRTRLKVCCIQSVAEARLAIAFGADALGLVAEMPTGPGPIDDALIREIAASVPPPVATFLLTSLTRAADIAEHVRATRVNTVQICDLPEPGTYALLRRECPALRIVQVIHVQDELSAREAQDAGRHVDALLLDSGRTRHDTRELGGTGRPHDWAMSAEIVANSPVPVFLAGGLRPNNVAEAIAKVRPYGVDLCNGVRTGGALDAVKLAAFVLALEGSANA